jgi:hypothetical protein
MHCTWQIQTKSFLSFEKKCCEFMTLLGDVVLLPTKGQAGSLEL